MQLLHNLIAAAPYKIRTMLTENGIQFTCRKTDQYAFSHIFNSVCLENGTEHRLIRSNNS
ncbi:hypothetical protein ABO04_03300 [Nitrosomonas sp. HPC101]|nr:hypothetical protein [Nitrosomonas sp. HPC101]